MRGGAVIVAILTKADANETNCDECGGEFEDDKGISIELQNCDVDSIGLCSICKEELARAILKVLR